MKRVFSSQARRDLVDAAGNPTIAPTLGDVGFPSPPVSVIMPFDAIMLLLFQAKVDLFMSRSQLVFCSEGLKLRLHRLRP
ncbi:hypothetical protein U1Q18_032233 [Sarracenia purpurea var. burkii]